MHVDPDSEDHPDIDADLGQSETAEELVGRAQAGDRQAREALLAAHLPALRGFVRLRLGRALRGHEESVDLVQSVCGDVLSDIDQFEYRGPESFRHWLLRRAENKIRTRGRFWNREKRAAVREHVRLDDEGAGDLLAAAHALTPSRNAAAREEIERLEAAFIELSDDDRRVILLSRVVGMEHAAIAEEMGRTPLATRSLLSRALAKLAAKLEP